MNPEQIGKAVFNLSDICAAASGDLHLLHLNMQGCEFDMLHKEVLKTYYEQLAEDYDSLAEFGACYGGWAQNPNDAAKRAGWQSIDKQAVDRTTAIQTTDAVLDSVLAGMKLLNNALSEIKDCPISIGIQNWLQGRIEYWAKEVYYFNKRRS